MGRRKEEGKSSLKLYADDVINHQCHHHALTLECLSVYVSSLELNGTLSLIHTKASSAVIIQYDCHHSLSIPWVNKVKYLGL